MSVVETEAVRRREAIERQPFGSPSGRMGTRAPGMAGPRPSAGLEPNAIKVELPERALGVMDLGFDPDSDGD